MSLNRQANWMVRTVTVVILIQGVYNILALGGVFDYLGIYISIITHWAGNVAVWLLLSYILLSARKGQTKLPWYDVILLLAGLIPSIYVATRPGRVLLTSELPDLISTTEIVLFLALIASILEAGRRSGGPAKVAIFASALMGTISGSSVANVVTTGTFTIPMMKSLGYKPHFAGAVASNGG